MQRPLRMANTRTLEIKHGYARLDETREAELSSQTLDFATLTDSKKTRKALKSRKPGTNCQCGKNCVICCLGTWLLLALIVIAVFVVIFYKFYVVKGRHLQDILSGVTEGYDFLNVTGHPRWRLVNGSLIQISP
ncbi:MAG: hypothetical protein KVP17_004257 [Porospora cf. gigantea B]|uniref:uncharacterized protein n=1 Tax=Porospora cf. gigantea B TaxID=2853592 RepID=UPI003571EB0B|nr:MAG: hypothetical protein KVP17_004257 [Porospora cf. gigantea B]